MHHLAYIALGSNLGDRDRFLATRARRARGTSAESRRRRIFGRGDGTGRATFRRARISIRWSRSKPSCRRASCSTSCSASSRRPGACATVHWGPRTLDLDIVRFGDARVDEPDLVIPHPAARQSRLVAARAGRTGGDANERGATATRRAITIRDFQERKDRGEKLVVVTAYDALFGRLVDESGVDAVLVGDSLGNLLAGYETTLPVTLDQMIYHARSTRARREARAAHRRHAVPHLSGVAAGAHSRTAGA